MKVIFETNDLLLAAFLLAKNRHLIAIRPPRTGNHCILVFADPEQIIAAPRGIKQEFLGDGLVRVRTLAQHFGRLKVCCAQVKIVGRAIEYMRLDEVFLPARVKKLKLRFGVQLEKSRRVQAIGTEE